MCQTRPNVRRSNIPLRRCRFCEYGRVWKLAVSVSAAELMHDCWTAHLGDGLKSTLQSCYAHLRAIRSRPFVADRSGPFLLLLNNGMRSEQALQDLGHICPEQGAALWVTPPGFGSSDAVRCCHRSHHETPTMLHRAAVLSSVFNSTCRTRLICPAANSLALC